MMLCKLILIVAVNLWTIAAQIAPPANVDLKSISLNSFRVQDAMPGNPITTNFGTRAGNDSDSLKVGPRGPFLMEDFLFREKTTHFDHERIPERVVHARGFGAHGYFQLYESLERYTKAEFLRNTTAQTPVFVRFSTVIGFKGSPDTPRDVRGFATKFYTSEGNIDLVATIFPSSSFKMQSSSQISFMLPSLNQTTKFLKLPPLTTTSGTSSPSLQKLLT